MVDRRPGKLDTSSIDGVIGYRLRRAQVGVFARFQQHFAELDVKPAEYSVLVLIADNDGLRPSQVAAALGIKRANFVALAAGLEARGLVERRHAIQDRRSHTLILTIAGQALVTKIRRFQRRFEAELVEELGGPGERDRLISLLKKLG